MVKEFAQRGAVARPSGLLAITCVQCLVDKETYCRKYEHPSWNLQIKIKLDIILKKIKRLLPLVWRRDCSRRGVSR